MEISIKSLVLLVSILFTGLTAGLCFTWSNAITPGLGKLNDMVFLQSFQSINKVILNPRFLITFFGPGMLLPLNSYFHRNADFHTYWSFLLAAILFFGGVALVTIFKNVPLNEMLNNSPLEKVTKMELADLRSAFEKPWNRWHMIRTVTSICAFALLLIGILFKK